MNTNLFMQHKAKKEAQAAIRQRIYGDWFAEKRYVSLLVFKKSCPLGHQERLTYSFVQWLHWIDPDQSKPYSKIAPRLSISERAVSAAAKSLEKRGLLTISNGPSNQAVLRLSSITPEWIVLGKNGKLAGNRLLQSAKIIDSEIRLSSYDMALLATLYGLGIQRGTTMIQNAKSGLASMISVSSKTVASSLAKLSNLELVKCSGNTICLLRPTDHALKYFVDCGSEEAIQQTKGKLFSLNLDTPIGARLNDHLLQVQKSQFESGWKGEQPFDFWKEVFFNNLDGLRLDDRLSLLEEFLVERYPALWIAAEDQHQESGQAGNCRFLLASTTEDAIVRLRREKGYA